MYQTIIQCFITDRNVDKFSTFLPFFYYQLSNRTIPWMNSTFLDPNNNLYTDRIKINIMHNAFILIGQSPVTRLLFDIDIITLNIFYSQVVGGDHCHLLTRNSSCSNLHIYHM